MSERIEVPLTLTELRKQCEGLLKDIDASYGIRDTTPEEAARDLRGRSGPILPQVELLRLVCKRVYRLENSLAFLCKYLGSDLSVKTLGIESPETKKDGT